jgi:transketolase C-terminal domain/subunit
MGASQMLRNKVAINQQAVKVLQISSGIQITAQIQPAHLCQGLSLFLVLPESARKTS